ncbi:MAG: 4Fe-4S binding protein [Treponema sp.]|nr:4Fe-4S binding protein [Treponema sp.]
MKTLLGKLFAFWKHWSFVILIAMVVASLFDFRLALVAILCMASPIVISIFAGRFWCGNLCPRGNFFAKTV